MVPHVHMSIPQAKIAAFVGYLMAPVAFTAYTLAFWRLAADLKWADAFFISAGVFSRWQVWLALAIAIHACASGINRFSRLRRRVAS